MSEARPNFIPLDEEGYFRFDELRVADAELGHRILSSLTMDERGRAWVRFDDVEALVENFDEPFVVKQVHPQAGGPWKITLPYNVEAEFELQTLTVDEWDRFHGRTTKNIPFVFSRSAQSDFFNLVDSFGDDYFEVQGKRYETPAWLMANPDTHAAEFWTEIYRTETPRWELDAPAKGLELVYPRLKLTRQRVLVLGCGSGNDAAFFAQQGNIVTAVDFSEEAIARAKAKYSHIEDLRFVQADAFKLPKEFRNHFDLVFEHTLFCAIDPARRAELIKVWLNCLTPGGHLLGIFFTLDKPLGPPFGALEWELRQRLLKGFRPLFWRRLRESTEQRLGYELLVYSQKLSN